MWRDSARVPRCGPVDGRAIAPVLIALFHPHPWKMYIAVTLVGILAIIEYYGLTVPVAMRMAKRAIAGDNVVPSGSSDETGRYLSSKQSGGW